MATPSWRKPKTKRDAEIARLSTMMEEMKREFGSQREALEEKIKHLERELTQTQLEVQHKANPTTPASEPTSRRRMLKQLGVAAAGLAAASVATGIAQEAPTAEAAATFSINDGTSPLVVQPNPAAGLTSLTTPATGSAGVGFQALTIENKYNGLSTANPALNYYPFDALVTSSAGGTAVNALSQSGTAPAVLGVNGSSNIINTAATDPTPVPGNFGITGASDLANGVLGLSNTGTGVYGFGTGNGGYGGVFQVSSNSTNITGSAPLRIVPEPQIGSPSVAGIPHLPGEVHIDKNGDVHICTSIGVGGGIPMTQAQISRRYPGLPPSDQQRLLVGATPGWRQLATTASASFVSTYFLSSPIRVVGGTTEYPAGTPVVNGLLQWPPPTNTTKYDYINYYQVQGTWGSAGQTQTIPSNAVGIICTFTVSGGTTGFAILFPGNSTSTPLVSTINYATGVKNFATGATVGLGVIPNTATRVYPSNAAIGTKGIAVSSYSSSVKVLVDVIAYIA
ncbi:MAG: hypothetical protein HXX20_01550 [Chloroflexi bacterium]|nr:hypothetical protein [Chloroflexota bacterium]